MIASQIVDLRCNVLMLNEVRGDNFELYNQACQQCSDCVDDSGSVYSRTGRGDRLAIYFDNGRFELLEQGEPERYRNYRQTKGVSNGLKECQ